MSNLISDEKRAAYKVAINNIHDTFSRCITIWHRSAQEITFTEESFDAFSDSNAFTDRGVENVIYTPESQTFKARIKYIDKQDKEFGLAVADYSNRTNSSNIDIGQEFQLVRIKVDAETNDYIAGCEKIYIEGDDRLYVPFTIPRPHGVFAPDWYTIYLKSQP